MEPTIFARDVGAYETQRNLLKAQVGAHDWLIAHRQQVSLDGENTSWLIASTPLREHQRMLAAARSQYVADIGRLGSRIIVPESIAPMIAVYTSLYEAKGTKPMRQATARLDTVLTKYGSLKSDLARQIVADVKAALEA